MTLPGAPGPTITAISEALTDDARAAFLDRLLGAMPAERLAAILRRHGFTVSASTIRTYRRSVRRAGGDALE
ncbi:hypothetical protein Afil01_62400 [Actinorhabdospora filicis]|uniref:Uncharacterized protein n=1 Tax=Actinorhabdospora filicis TaxID=1785913 RepID=A0A9W6SSU5_9ACTN|nr:hypothetical protein Afil01_62400 [Actinorhabdospora filicis]